MPLILLLVVVSLICLTLQIPHLSALVEWRIDYIEQGEWWRILSGNFTHTNFTHLAMNISALWVIAFIFRPSAVSYSILLIMISLAVGLGILLTPIQGYVGLSGTLHGLFAFYALTEALQGRKSSWLLVVGVVMKVFWELSIGSPASTAEMINARVAVEAHLIGLVSGCLLAIVQHLHVLKVKP
ncbi:rhombosortase [Vibrio ponticus]|uniref:Rhombosortase n=1 Tax=Vibrio ponticus TaxID=265668 RepID=A0A3N3DYG8_9VIBR|nr:rhombosortase [Vibrio ponticus]ROV59429.1 rhombosortase [Vibrio ponticus]